MTFYRNQWHKRFHGVLFVLLLVFQSGLLAPVSAQAPVDEHVNDATGAGLSSNNKILKRINEHFDKFPPQTLYNARLRRFVGLDRVFEFDDSPLGERIPVVLVPGRAEEFQPNSWWKKFERLVDNNKAFKKDFKLYVYIYDSRLPLKAQAYHFNRDMNHLFGNLPATQKAVLITYSLGGMITTEALRDPAVLKKVHTVFAIAVPFHGSPMFDPSWFSTYLQPTLGSPIRKFWDKFLYRAYLFDKTNLIEGLKWDNFDGSMPQFDPKTVNVHGDQIFVSPTHDIEDHFTKTLKEKTVIYASYLENGFTKTNQPMHKPALPKHVVTSAAQASGQVLVAVLPFYGVSVHSVFTYMNNQLANIPTFTPERPEGKNTHLYRFNDGIIPLSSMLWLPIRKEPYDVDFKGLIHAVDVPKVRIFPNLDHMHIGDYDNLQPRKIVTADIVHPEDGKRKPNQWLLHDLMELRPALEAMRQEAAQ